jgi:ABC-type proline/glycine betaine transport system ATPase subunit
VFVTHDMDEALQARHAHRRDARGRLLQYDTPSRLLAHPSTCSWRRSWAAIAR